MLGTSNHTAKPDIGWLWTFASLEFVTIAAGLLFLFNVFGKPLAYFSIICSIIAVLIALFCTPLRRFLLEVVIVASLILIGWSVVQVSPLLSSPQPGTVTTQQTFLLSTDKLLSDVNSLTPGQKVRATLIVNGEEYHYDATVVQKPLTKSTETASLPDKTVSVTLKMDKSGMLEDFIAHLPNATTIYILPIA